MSKSSETLQTFTHDGQMIALHSLAAVESLRGAPMSELPYIIRILLESALRNQSHPAYQWSHVESLARWQPGTEAAAGNPLPARARAAAGFHRRALRGRSRRLRSESPPRRRSGPHRAALPVDLVIDHSVQLDETAHAGALVKKCRARIRAQRRTLRPSCAGARARSGTCACCRPASASATRSTWSASPPSSRSIPTPQPGGTTAFPDTLVGTDSHTTMVNSHGRARLGRRRHRGRSRHAWPAHALRTPVVVGVHLTGALRRRRHRHRPRARRSPSCCVASAWSASSSNTSAPASRPLASMTAPRSPTWPRNTAPPRVSSPSMRARSTTCA
jgi:aconitate hydratase